MSWPTIQITKVARVVGGATPKTDNPDFWDGAIDWATPKDLSNLQGKLISSTPRKITDAGLRSCAAEVLPAGSVLFSSRAPIGHVAINTVPMATNQGFKSFVPDPELDANFLYWWLDANRERLQALGTGATFKEVSKAVVQRIEVPLPPLEEQKRIAEILDQADALRRLRARALEKLNTLGQALFHEMFGNPLNAGDVSLSDVLLASGNGFQVDQNDSGEGIPVTRIETIWNGEIDPYRVKWSSPDMARAERFLLRPGDILFSHINSPEHIAKTAIYEGHPDRLLHGINLLRLQPDRRRVSPYWLVTFLKTDPVRRFFRSRCKKAVNQASLNQKNLGELKFRLPDCDAQAIFSERLAGIVAQIPALASSSEKFDALFNTVHYRAFRGEL